jgi:serine/threonine-protein kinase
VEQRINVFLGVLDAVRYAHARGVLHRDLKPANIMIGQYGEVTVMDWGIAKPIRSRLESPQAQPLDRTFSESGDQRLLETQHGALAGTPLYMSPEQAAGHNDDLDERSDVYALSVVLCEWLVLEHPLAGKTTLTEVLAAIISNEPDADHIAGLAMRAGVPMEFVHVVLPGLARSREERFQSVAAMENALKQIQDGHITVKCHVTLAKSLAHRFTHWIDRNVMIYTMALGLTGLTLVSGLGYGLYRLVRALVG